MMQSPINKSSSSNKRTRDTVLVKPILFGNYAQHLGKKADASKTHKWTCYVRGLNANEDLSYIKKVVFELHESFVNPIREVTEAPWEIAEEGWGEFEIKIKIFFQDTSEKPIQLIHLLSLYPKSEYNKGKKNIVEEHYEELVFVNPKPSFYELLQSTYVDPTNQTPGNAQLEESGTNDPKKKRRKNSFALSVQSVVESNAPKLDEKKDLELLMRTCKALDLKINELNEEIAKKMERSNLFALNTYLHQQQLASDGL